MPKELKLGKVNAGRVNRRGKANLSHDCSYTTQFAKVTPSFSKLMLPNSSLRGSINTEVRVMPMPLPPHGVVKLHRYGQFIPLRDDQFFQSYQGLQRWLKESNLAKEKR